MATADLITQLKQDFDDVYAAGKAAGGGSGDYDQGYEDGKNSVYNGFWDNFQDYGNRVSYVRAFMFYWDDNIFAPKYNMQPTNAQEMFYGCEITDLKGICEKQGITLDFSKATSTVSLFYTSTVTKIGTIDLSSASSANQMFYKCRGLESIDLIVCTASHTFNNAFSNCSKLKEIRFGGEIGKSLNLQYSSLLSNESIQSIIDGLADLSPRYYVAQQTGPDTFEKGALIENIISVTECGKDSNGETLYNVEYGIAIPGIYSTIAYKEGGSTAQTLTLHATVGSKLTDEQKATITAKNWELVY